MLVPVCGLLAGCATPALWEATDPHEFVAISRSTVTEQDLKAKGLPYYVDKERDLLYVEKNTLQKTKDYAIRTVATPVTVVIDAATTIVVVGGAVALVGGALYLLSHDARIHYEGFPGGTAGESKRAEAERKELESIDMRLEDIRLGK